MDKIVIAHFRPYNTDGTEVLVQIATILYVPLCASRMASVE